MGWRESKARWQRVYEELVGHFIITFVILTGIRGIEWLAALLWDEGKLLFGVLPIIYVIDALDLYVLLAFAYLGVKMGMTAYKDES